MQSTLRKYLFSALTIAALCSGTNAYAHEDHKQGDDHGKYPMKHKAMKRHHQAMNDIQKMLKDLMLIVRDLNHKPSAADKDRINAMVTRLDEIAAERKKMKKRYMEKNRDHHNDQ